MERLHVYAPYISACNSERMVKIGAELPKLSPKYNWVSVFLDHPVGLNVSIVTLSSLTFLFPVPRNMTTFFMLSSLTLPFTGTQQRRRQRHITLIYRLVRRLTFHFMISFVFSYRSTFCFNWILLFQLWVLSIVDTQYIRTF